MTTRQRDNPRALIRYALVGVALTVALVWLLYQVRDTLLLIYVAALVAVGLSPLVGAIRAAAAGHDVFTAAALGGDPRHLRRALHRRSSCSFMLMVPPLVQSGTRLHGGARRIWRAARSSG